MPENKYFDWLHKSNANYSVVELLVSYGAIILLFVVSYYLIKRYLKNSISVDYHVPTLLKKYLFKASLILFSIITFYLLLLWLEPYFMPNIYKILKHILAVLLILSIGYMLSRIIEFVREISVIFYSINENNDLSARKARTQFKILERILSFVIAIGTFSFVLMTFDSVRSLGTTILASAGVIGIIIGFAAQKSISTLVAGIQIAITQPIRIDDVVIVEGEWGRIEELTLTYVVVALWDKRRLIVPINYFIEKPFQNWTRTTSDLLATVFIYMDYTVPVDDIRTEVSRLLVDNVMWDGVLNVVQITNVTQNNVEVRILVSAENSDKAFNLRCMIREAIILYLQKNHPEALPKSRMELQPIAFTAPDIL